MELNQRFIVSCQITIAEVNEKDPDPGETFHERSVRKPKPMTTAVTLALVDTYPETIVEALSSYVKNHWASKPHKITKVHSITAQNDYIWSEA